MKYGLKTPFTSNEMKKKGTAQIMFHLCRYWQSELCSTHRLRSRAHILSLLRFTGIMVSRAQLFSKVNKSIHHPYCQAKACSHANVLLHFKVKIRTCQQQHPQVPGESCPQAAPFRSAGCIYPAARAQQLGNAPTQVSSYMDHWLLCVQQAPWEHPHMPSPT